MPVPNKPYICELQDKTNLEASTYETTQYFHPTIAEPKTPI